MLRSPAAWGDRLRRVERWLLPGECLSCGEPVSPEHDPLICDLCRVRWRAPAPPICGVCGEPSPMGLSCRICPEWPAGFDRARSAVVLDPAVRRVVHLFKYQGWRRLADVMARPIVPLLENDRGATLVPIPLGRKRRRQRGYNQAEELARSIGRLSGHRVSADRLFRSQETATQTRLAPEARRANLAGVFRATDDSRPAILVDDVFTTGATLVSAAAALLEAGAERVVAVTFARAAAPLAGAAAALNPVIHSSFREAF
ncbi:MAG: double zinc ribbon domain-containing protein [Gemmatimonadales bacterium]|nr:double zinc ribbon domain-containing protein [Gemmatimonadales bacterium]MDZ4389130.1 double zinc ribbon domain-containing protein [Gemmatimonadales bacterium]